VKALGMSNCAGCHLPGDFKASTHNKDMASAMWTHFVQGLRAKGGGTLFCDSCHQGQQKLLARGDKKALSKFMEANYQDKLERAGYVAREDMKSRPLRPCGTDSLPASVPANDDEGMVEIQVLGRVAAGLPLLAEENGLDTVRIGRALVRGGREVFGLRVTG